MSLCTLEYTHITLVHSDPSLYKILGLLSELEIGFRYGGRPVAKGAVKGALTSWLPHLSQGEKVEGTRPTK